MQLIRFLLARRTKAFFSPANWKSWLANFFFLLAFVFNGWLFAFLYDNAEEKIPGLHPALIFAVFCIIISGFPVLLKFFPSLQWKKMLISCHLPLKKKQIAMADLLVFGLCQPLYFFLLCSITVFYAAAQHADGSLLVSSLLFLVSGFLLAENVINAFSWKKGTYFIMLAFCMLLQAACYYFCRYSDFLWLIVLAGMQYILLIFLYFSFYQVRPADWHRRMAGNAKRIITSFEDVFKIMFRRPTAGTQFICGAFFKFLLLIPFSLGARNLGTEGLFAKMPFMFMLITPFIYFSYLYNNLWGYFKSLAQNIAVGPEAAQRLREVYNSMLFPFWIADGILSFCILLSLGLFSFKLLLIYGCLSVYLYMMGRLGSVMKYREMKRKFSLDLRGNSSQTIILLEWVPVFGLGMIYKKDLLLWLICVLLCLVSAAIGLYLTRYRRTLWKTFKPKLYDYAG